MNPAHSGLLHDHPQLSDVLIALFVVMLWATSWVLIKVGLDEIPPLTFAGLRYLLAFFCLVPFSVRVQRRKTSSPLSRSVFRQLIALGLLLYALTQGAIFLALDYLPAVTVNLLWSFSTIIVALFGMLWLAEYPTRFQWVGIVMAAVGAMIYFVPIALPGRALVGIGVSTVGIVANAFAVILGRQVNRT